MLPTMRVALRCYALTTLVAIITSGEPIQEAASGSQLAAEAGEPTGAKAAPVLIKFIGMQHGYDSELEARQALALLLEKVTRRNISIDAFEVTSSEGSVTFDATWHSADLVDCAERPVEELMATIRQPTSGAFTRDFKLHLSENFNYPRRTELQWQGECENVGRKRSQPQPAPGSSADPDAAVAAPSSPASAQASDSSSEQTGSPEASLDSNGTSSSSDSEGPPPPPLPATITTAEPTQPSITPEPTVANMSSLFESSFFDSRDLNEAGASITEPSASTPQPSEPTSPTTELAAPTVEEMDVKELTNTTTATTTTTTTTQTPSTNNTTTSEPGAAGNSSFITSLVSESSGTQEPESTTPTTTPPPTTTTTTTTTPTTAVSSSVPTEPSTFESSSRSSEESDNERTSDELVERQQAATQSSSAATTAPKSAAEPQTGGEPHFGKYVGLSTAFLIFIAYLICARAYRRQGMYELHESSSSLEARS